MLPLRIELAMTFKAVFLNIWPSADPDMGVHGADRGGFGCNILILPVDASVMDKAGRFGHEKTLKRRT